jgi:hypothetical protein
MRNTLYINGDIIIAHNDVDGTLLDTITIENMVVNKGKERLAKLLNGIATTPFKYIQLGTSANSPALTDTQLYNYYTEGLAALSYESPHRAVFKHTFTFWEDVTLREAGIFDNTHSSGPTMLSRGTFADRAVTAGQSFETTWRITIG